MLLVGSKTDGTDMHSYIARLLNVSRDVAKTLNYARLYGSGEPLAQQHLRQHNPHASDSDIRRMTSTLFKETKGVRWCVQSM